MTGTEHQTASPVNGDLDFILEQIILSDGRQVGAALNEDRWVERELLRPILAEENGRPRYALVYEELPRGHWKTGVAAAIALVHCTLHRDTDVVVAAADRDQA